MEGEILWFWVQAIKTEKKGVYEERKGKEKKEENTCSILGILKGNGSCFQIQKNSPALSKQSILATIIHTCNIYIYIFEQSSIEQWTQYLGLPTGPLLFENIFPIFLKRLRVIFKSYFLKNIFKKTIVENIFLYKKIAKLSNGSSFS